MIIGRAKANGQRATSLGTQVRSVRVWERTRNARLCTSRTVPVAPAPRDRAGRSYSSYATYLLLLTLRTSDRSRRAEPPYASYEQSVAGVEGRATHKPEAESLSLRSSTYP
jgi:hypothetical protein